MITHPYLESLLSQRAWKPGERLPSLRVMAKGAQMAPATFARYIHAYVKAGRLALHPRLGIHFQSLPSRSDDAYRIGQGAKWKRLVQTIRQDFQSGLYAPGSKRPDLRTWQNRYRVGYRTLQRAEAELIREGWLDIGGTFRDPRFPDMPRSGSLKVLALGLAYQDHKLRYQSDRLRQWVEGLHQTGSARRFALTTLGISNQDTVEKMEKALRMEGVGTDHIAGIMVWSTGLEPSLKKKLSKVLQSFSRPVAWIEEDTPKTKEGHFPESHTLVVPDFHTAGERVAHALASLGHRKMAFLSPWPEKSWSENRFKGVHSALKVYSGSHIWVPSQSDLHPSKKFVHEKTSLKDKAIQAHLHDLSIRTIDVAEKHIQRWSLNYSLDSLKWAFQDIEIETEVARAMEPYFQACLLRKDMTAWICVNDVTAMAAMKFLERQGKKVGKTISLVGFDNTRAAADYDIASYDFGFREIAPLIWDYFLSALAKRSGKARQVLSARSQAKEGHPHAILFSGYLAIRKSMSTLHLPLKQDQVKR